MWQNSPSRKSMSVFAAVYAAIACAIAAYFFQLLFLRTAYERVPFDTDEADHALAGLEMFTAFTQFNVSHIVRAFVEQAFYPPLHSLVVALSYAFTGPSLAASRIPSVIMLGVELLVIALATYLALNKRHRSERLLAAAVTLLAAATCYTALLNSTLCMLEPLGLVFVAVLILVATKFETSTSRNSVLLALSWLAVLVCLSKYSFGIIVAPAVPLAVLTSRVGPFKERFRASIFVSSIIAIGLISWLLVTDAYAAWRFISGHPSSGAVFSIENFLYYPKAWYEHYAANAFASVMVLLLAAVGLFRNWTLLAVRLSFFIFVLGSIALTISTTNEVRHFLVVTPGVWFLAGLGIVRLNSATEGKVRIPLGAVVSIIFLGVVASGMLLRNQRIQKDLTQEFEGLPVFAHLHEYIAANVDARRPIIVSGMFDQLGNQALLWTLAKTNSMSYRDIQLDSYPFREETYVRARERKRNIPYAWRIENFPRTPLSAVLAQKHYFTAIQLSHNRHRRFRTPDALEFRETMGKYPYVHRKTHGWSVLIYNIEE